MMGRSEGMELLCFTIERNCFALPIRSVVKITPMMAFSPLESGSEGCLGMVVLHGRPAYLLDISPRLNLPPRGVDPERMILFIEDGGPLVGVIVDDIKEIVRIEREDIVEGISSKLISALARVEGEMIPILNPKAIREMLEDEGECG
ncbi:TPA: chemotaxis protein CheW [Candidatus Poribacteria bacterium]|nr:chemotaxis protein CheW [Candidatus Poribacteria bacterium]